MTQQANKIRKDLLRNVPYRRDQLEAMKWHHIIILRNVLGVHKGPVKKDQMIDEILLAQEEMKSFDPRVEPFCEMCGRHVMMREKAHIVAEAGDDMANLLWLCPSCHRVFDRHLKLRLFDALKAYKVKGLPKSWETPFGVGKNEV
ncbi:HNH endonuclease [Thermodesulfobacteriota bacterium]